MNPRSLFVLGCALVVVAGGATNAFARAVAGVHTIDQTHDLDKKTWVDNSCWEGSPPQSAASAQLTTNWTNTQPALASLAMFDYKAMGETMNMLSHYTQNDLTESRAQITLSNPGTPPTMEATIDSREYFGAGGFHMTLAEPLSMTLNLVRFEPTTTPGELHAVYAGMQPASRWTVVDPLASSTPLNLVGSGPQPIEILVLTAVPEPTAAGLALTTLVALAALRRRRAASGRD